MMKIEHLAIWVSDLERMREFYSTYFGATSKDKYINAKKGFSSYFLSFGEGARLEIMHQEGMHGVVEQGMGLAHLAISLGSKEQVDTLTEELRSAGYEIAGEPRTTGDGYYESVVKDPEGNVVELTV